MNSMLPFVKDDGGRAAAGFQGAAGDCVARAIAIASGAPYKDVYDRLAALAASRGLPRSARNGVDRKDYGRLLDELGFVWTPVMGIGTGCTMRLRKPDLPAGYENLRLVVRLSRHLTAVVDGAIRDTHDPCRDGTRCVYGYWTAP